MSDSVRPHRQQPTRLPRPWDSPGKNTGVGCHFLLQCMKVTSENEVAQSCLTPSHPMDCSLPGPSVHGIFQARVLEWVAIAFSVVFAYVALNPSLRRQIIVNHDPRGKQSEASISTFFGSLAPIWTAPGNKRLNCGPSSGSRCRCSDPNTLPKRLRRER